MRFGPKLIFIETLTMFLLAVVLVAGSCFVSINSFNQQTEETLEVAVNGFHGDVKYLRNIGRNIDITVFEGDTRVDSSIKRRRNESRRCRNRNSFKKWTKIF